jgi:5-methylcytosine-specific restriction protein B
MLEASKSENQNRPYFLILDEMNLSHVERYFADFLSTMESSEAISLRPEMEWKDTVPSSIKLPKNLFIVGTVNIDETTYMFSPKVLDRANVIEFRVTSNQMETYLKHANNINLDKLNHLGAGTEVDFVTIAKNRDITLNNATTINQNLIKFFDELKKTGAEFGYRSASEILRFSAIAAKLESSWSTEQILDAAVMQKLLPKVHGSRRKLEPVLKTLASLCVKESIKTVADFKIDALLLSENQKEINDKLVLPVSFEKISRMYKGLLDNGFTSYAEA